MTMPEVPPTPPGGEPQDAPPVHGSLANPRNVRWKVIVGFGAWSIFVWSTRIVNIWRDLLLSTDERVWLSVMALVFVVLGIATFVIGLGLRRWPPTSGDLITVGLLGGWTLGIWVTRTLDIVLGGDHEVPFVVVHVALAIISVTLAALSWRTLSSSRAAIIGSEAASELETESVSVAVETPQ